MNIVTWNARERKRTWHTLTISILRTRYLPQKHWSFWSRFILFEISERKILSHHHTTVKANDLDFKTA